MNKKVIALVVAGALAAPLMAQAQQSNVTIYGRLNASLDSVRMSDATDGTTYYNRTRISSNISRIGFKGTEDLGNGLKTIWQIETAANFDNANGNGVGAGSLGDRPSFLGLTGNFGTIQLGRLDLPGKDLDTAYNDPWADVSGIGDNGNFWGSGGPNKIDTGAGSVAGTVTQFQAGSGASFTTGAALNMSLHTRASNTIQYTTPTWGGFSFKAAYSAQNEALNVNNAAKIWGASGKYENGPLTVVLAAERQFDLLVPPAASTGTKTAGAATSTLTNVATQPNGLQPGTGFTGRSNSMVGVAAGYLFPSNTRVGAGYQRLKFDDTATTSRDRNGWMVSVAQTFGNNVLRAEYLRNNDYKGNSALSGSNTGARMYILGYGYNMSKRTQLYTTYSKIDNDSAAAYDFGSGKVGGVGAGADPSGVSVGILHFF